MRNVDSRLGQQHYSMQYLVGVRVDGRSVQASGGGPREASVDGSEARASGQLLNLVVPELTSSEGPRG